MEDNRWPPTKSELRIIEVRPGFLDPLIFLKVLCISTKLQHRIKTSHKERAYVYDRHFMGLNPMKGSMPLPNEMIVTLLSYVARHYDWCECYILNKDSDERMQKKLDRYMAKLPIKEEKIRREYEDVFYFFARYDVTDDHWERLCDIAQWSKIDEIQVLEMDMMIRIRKMAFLNKEMTIRTKFHVDYQYFVFRGDDGATHGEFVKVGAACPVCLRECKLELCLRCRETGYCSKEHQVKHWSIHKRDCILPI